MSYIWRLLTALLLSLTLCFLGISCKEASKTSGGTSNEDATSSISSDDDSSVEDDDDSNDDDDVYDDDDDDDDDDEYTFDILEQLDECEGMYILNKGCDSNWTKKTSWCKTSGFSDKLGTETKNSILSYKAEGYEEIRCYSSDSQYAVSLIKIDEGIVNQVVIKRSK